MSQHRLKQLQEKLQKEKTKATTPQTDLQGRELCTICNRRVVRRGKPFCSRCTIKGVVEEQRSVLPGVDITKEQATASGFLLSEDAIGARIINHADVQESAEGYTISNSNVDVVNAPIGIDRIQLPPKSYTRKQVCKLLEIGVTTLCRWEKKGYTPQPPRMIRTRTCVYSQELVEEIKKFRDATYTPPISSNSLAESEEARPGVFRPPKKGQFVGKKLERTVASKLNFGRSTLLH